MNRRHGNLGTGHNGDGILACDVVLRSHRGSLAHERMDCVPTWLRVLSC